jgi:hypothetical protein
MMLYCLAKVTDVSKELAWIILERLMMTKGATFFKPLHFRLIPQHTPILTSTITPL